MAEIIDLKAEEGAVTTDAVVAAKASATAPLQSIVATADAASASLRAQRDALQAQIAPLQSQIAALNAQIAAAEGPGAQVARSVIAAIEQAARPQPSASAARPNLPPHIAARLAALKPQG